MGETPSADQPGGSRPSGNPAVPSSAQAGGDASPGDAQRGEPRRITEHKHGGLDEFSSTAICGNDITSSCLYVSALAIAIAGKLAPLCLLLIAGLLYLFRGIYAEVVGALPLNGGAYNALLNTTSKFRASVAACLTILSYMATAVISAIEAMHYLDTLYPPLPEFWLTIGLLAVFTILTIMGISESARIAVAIFFTHLASLTLLLLVGIYFVITNGVGTLKNNLTSDLTRSVEAVAHAPHDTGGESVAPQESEAEPTGSEAETQAGSQDPPAKGPDGHAAEPLMQAPISLGMALFLGFGVALLGISGFESSANFVEEQAEGVFPKTLRNMWLAVSFFNPAMAILALALVSIAEIQTDKAMQNALLAHMGNIAGGPWLSTLISIDAFLVLSGAVLTSFVGVNGLVRRMALDRCLPQFLLKTNPRGTTHRILITFFLMAVSVLFITGGELDKLAGVYTISFLAVMALFGIGNVLLKVQRAKLPRPSRAPWLAVLVAIAAVLVGLVSNAVRKPEYLFVFLYYFVPTMMVVAFMLWRIPLLRLLLYLVRASTATMIRPMSGIKKYVREKIEEINSQQVVFFTRGDNIANLNNAMLYVKANENTNRIKVVTVVRDRSHVQTKLADDLKFLDQAYPDIDIEYVVIEGQFGPQLIQELSAKWDVPTNLMFIGAPTGHLMYGLAELGGVRLII